jgi:processive 1,2-diacylglycerol beta-glucosyltransferase
MIRLYDLATNQPCGTLSDAQFQVLVDALEEESPTDTDYYVNRDTVDTLEAQGADAGLVRALRDALGEREEMDVRWERV